MTYQIILEIASSNTLLQRIAACAASEGIDDPQVWVRERMWKFASQPGWDDSWLYAKENSTINMNPDIGQRDDVINDAAILSAVQALRAA